MENGKMIIRFFRHNTYGNNYKYALDFNKEIQGLTGKKTLSEANQKLLEGMGFSFLEVTKPDDINVKDF